MVSEGILQDVGLAVVNPVTFWVLVGLFAVVIFSVIRTMHLTDLPRSYVSVIALLVPVVVLEFGLRALFGMFGVPLDFGSYDFKIPFVGAYTVTHGVMLARFFDFVFNFGLFRAVGVSVLDGFMLTAPAVFPDPDIFFKLFVFLWVNSDAIIEFIFFYALFLAVAYFVGRRSESVRVWALGFAAIPVVLYMFFVSNPLVEFPEAMLQLQRVFYFAQNTDTVSLAVYFGTLALSFFLVMEILAFAIGMFQRGVAVTLRPQWQSKTWEISTQGLAFSYTLAFAIMYALHEYAWYIFFPALILYTLFKNASGKLITSAHESMRDDDIVERIAGYGAAKNTRKSGSGNVLIWALGAVVAVLGMLFVAKILAWW